MNHIHYFPIFVYSPTSIIMQTLEWTKEEAEKLKKAQIEIKARLFSNNLAYQTFDATLCKQGELVHEYADGKREIWDFSGVTAPHIVKVLLPNA